ncbi:MAG: PIN domain-containing protein, partial [Planctomycetota bacterium]
MDAPDKVISVFDSLPEDILERLNITEEVIDLAQKYIDANVLGKASISDSLHVATATVYNADLILSWNFKH